MTGIYLPYALPRRFVARTPLLLAFDSFHFSPLVPMDPSKPARVPLVQGPASAAATYVHELGAVWLFSCFVVRVIAACQFT